MNRRRFLEGGLSAAAAVALAGCRTADPETTARRREGRLLFTSQGRTLLIHADGTGQSVIDFQIPDQVTWQPGPFLADGRRLIVLSMEARRDGPGRPFDRYYHQTPTHLWLYDLERETLTEIATRDRLAVFYTPALLVSDDRLLVQVVRDAGGQIYSMHLDGSDAQEFTRLGEGLPYGLSLSPEGRRVAYHLASPQGYQVWTSDLEGGNRVCVAAHPDHLYFGPTWSPDGRWLAYLDCEFRGDPGHDWADVCVNRPDGSGHRVLTRGQAVWFGATYGPRGRPGGGSNVPTWTRDGQLLVPRRSAGSAVPWVFQPQRPDTDHFNRDYLPEQTRGGTQICRVHPESGAMTPLTSSSPPVWDFRCAESPDGRQIVFCRAETGGSPGLWVMGRDGSDPRMLTRGLDDQGADHPRWVPQPALGAAGR